MSGMLMFVFEGDPMGLVFGKPLLQIGYLLFGGVTCDRFVLLDLAGGRVRFGLRLNGRFELLCTCFGGAKLLF